MKNKFTLLIVFICLISSTFASHIDTSIARTISKNIFYEKASVNKNINYSEINPVLVFSCNQNDTTIYYVFNVSENNSFVIVSADDAVVPILGYSFNGYYSGFNKPPSFVFWMKMYEDQILYVIRSKIKANEQIKSLWKYYTEHNIPNQQKNILVGPLLSTTWGQGCYYNAQCPSENTAGSSYCYHVPTGCVATAMAQIMKYWSYPLQGTGTYSYNHATYGTQTANFGSTTYNWSSMPNNATSTNSAVATLMYHCGVSVNMNYSPIVSGAISLNVRNSLINYFGYSADASFISKSNYDSDPSVWENLLKNELDNNRPVFYKGNNSQGASGHAFVLDGYQSTNYFHFNWGWDSYYDGYFYLTDLTPGSNDFTYFQGAIINIKPNDYITTAFPKVVYNSNAGNVNIRQLPNTSATVITAIKPQGKLIAKTQDGNGWYEVYLPTTDGTYTTGWCSGAANLIQPDNSCTPRIKINTTSNVIIRTSAGISYSQVTISGANARAWNLTQFPILDSLYNSSEGKWWFKTDLPNFCSQDYGWMRAGDYILYYPSCNITLSQPNGGEAYISGNTIQINWVSLGNLGNVGIDYSTNGGSSWGSVISSTSNTGTFNWSTTSGINSTQCRIKVYSLSNSAVVGNSIENFSISPATSPAINLSGDLNFGNVQVSSSLQQTLTINNTGNGILTVYSLNCPLGFSGNWSGNIAVGSSQNVTITFSPTSTTYYSGSITVNSNSTSGINTITCSGTGITVSNPIINLSGNLNFGNVQVGNSLQQTLTINNTGNATLTISSLSCPNGFSGNWSGNIGAGNSQNISITFSPVSATSYNGTITVNSNAGSGTNTILCSGIGTSSSQEITICSWQYKSNMPIGRNAAASVTNGNYIYVIGGDYHLSHYRYDAVNDIFASMATLPGNGLDEGGAAIFNNSIYIIHNSFDENIRVYNVSADTWETKNLRPIGSFGRSPVFETVGNYIYAIGGADGNLIPSSQLDRYDPSNDTWATINNPMPTARSGASSIVYNNEIYIIGGRTNGSITGVVQVYNPSSNTWTTKASMPTPRSIATAELVDGAIYVIGGFTGSSYTNVIERYDITTNSWSQVNLLTPFINLGQTVSGVVNSKLYVIGGANYSGTIATTEELDFCPITSIKDVDNSNIVIIYPNPTNTNLIIDTENSYMNLFEIVNSIGSIVIKDKFKKSINLSKLSSGVYYLKLLDNNGNILKTEKIIKE